MLTGSRAGEMPRFAGDQSPHHGPLPGCSLREVGGLIEIVEWEPSREMAWTSITGVDQHGRWRLRERADGAGASTHVELRLSYGIAGSGLWGWVAEHVAAPIVRGNLRRSLHQLKRQVEHEQLRRRAARRRARTAAG